MLFTLNPDHLYWLQRDLRLRRGLPQMRRYVSSDSKYVYWALGFLGRANQSRSRRGRTSCRLIGVITPNTGEVKIFLLGAKPGIAQWRENG